MQRQDLAASASTLESRALSTEDINDCAVVGATDELKGQVGEADFSCGGLSSFVWFAIQRL